MLILDKQKMHREGRGVGGGWGARGVNLLVIDCQKSCDSAFKTTVQP